MAENLYTQRNQEYQGKPGYTSSPWSHTKDHAPPQTCLPSPDIVEPAAAHSDLPSDDMDFTWAVVGGDEMLPADTSERSYHDYSGTEYAITDDTNSSWLVVHQQQQHQQHCRTYSNATSGGVSDGPCLSVPIDGQPDWILGTGSAVDSELNYIPIAGNNHHVLLPDLVSSGVCNPFKLSIILTILELQPLYGGYRQATDGREEALYQEQMDNYCINQSDISRTSELPFGSFKPSHGAEPAWNPLEHRIPRYDPGYACFAPLSPSESLQNEASVSSPEDSKPEYSRDSRTTRPLEAAKPKLGWEHTVVRKGGLERVFEHIPEKSTHKFGCRKGSLHPKVKEKARRIRKLGACWACWVLKVPVSRQSIRDIWCRPTNLDVLVIEQIWIHITLGLDELTTLSVPKEKFVTGARNKPQNALR